MGLLLLLLLIGVPLIEIAVFIEVGGIIGLWPTIGIVIVTAVIGTAMLRQQGLATLQRARSELAAQRLPVKEIFDGLCLLVAGALLLTPGFVTDTFGFILLLPPLRLILGRWLWQALIARGKVRVDLNGDAGGTPGGPRARPDAGSPIIEGDYHEVPPDSDKTPDDDRRSTRRDPDR